MAGLMLSQFDTFLGKLRRVFPLAFFSFLRVLNIPLFVGSTDVQQKKEMCIFYHLISRLCVYATVVISASTYL